MNIDAIISEVFQGLCTGQVENANGFRLTQKCIDSTVSCAIAHHSTGPFQSISMSVKIQNAVEFGKYFKFLLQMKQVTPQAPTKNAFVVLMSEAGQLIWPEKI